MLEWQKERKKEHGWIDRTMYNANGRVLVTFYYHAIFGYGNFSCSFQNNANASGIEEERLKATEISCRTGMKKCWLSIQWEAKTILCLWVPSTLGYEHGGVWEGKWTCDVMRPSYSHYILYNTLSLFISDSASSELTEEEKVDTSIIIIAH